MEDASMSSILSTPIQRCRKLPNLIKELAAFKRREWWPEVESNHRHGDFQSPALPTELSGQCTMCRRRVLNPLTGNESRALFARGYVAFGKIVVFPGEKLIHFLLQVFARFGIYHIQVFLID